MSERHNKRLKLTGPVYGGSVRLCPRLLLNREPLGAAHSRYPVASTSHQYSRYYNNRLTPRLVKVILAPCLAATSWYGYAVLWGCPKSKWRDC